MVMDFVDLFTRNPTFPPFGALPWMTPRSSPTGGWISHGGGVVAVGHEGRGFAFENEGQRHDGFLRPLEISADLVRCGDWLAFIEDDGYNRADLSMSERLESAPGR